METQKVKEEEEEGEVAEGEKEEEEGEEADETDSLNVEEMLDQKLAETGEQIIPEEKVRFSTLWKFNPVMWIRIRIQRYKITEKIKGKAENQQKSFFFKRNYIFQVWT